jgi:hypothetical protein
MSSTGIIEINTKCSDVSFQSCLSELHIENKFIGYTPIQVFLPTGAHNYKLVKPGYIQPPPPPAPLTVGIANIQYGSKFVLDINLINSAIAGGLSINSSPDGAQIFIDGKDQKMTTPTIISGLIPGDHKYKMTLPGYTDMEGTFTMVLGQSTAVYATFAQFKDFGTLYIYPTPFLYGRIIPYILQGAKIYIDNTDTGKLMPLSITGLTKGVHTFRIERDGTVDRDGIFIINGEDTLLISVYPILKPKIGMLVIHAAPFVGDPKFARVYIDGKDTGQATDVRYALSEGSHTYRLQLEGYQDVEGKFDIVTNRITRVTPYMNHIGNIPLGKVNISSNPNGALVAIDDVYIGQYTPATVENLSDGDYTYRLTKPGYLDTIATFTIVNGQTADLNPMLIQSDTILDISCNVIAAVIYIDNHTEGWTTPAEVVGIIPGDHTYRLIVPNTYGSGFEDATGTFKLEEKKTTFVNVDMHPIKEGKGNLIINSIPIDAKVFVDDIDTKSITPDSVIGMDPGIHTVKLTLPGYHDWVGSVNIIPGNIVSIFETLIPEKV